MHSRINLAWWRKLLLLSLTLAVCVSTTPAQQIPSAETAKNAQGTFSPRANVDVLTAIKQRGKLRVGVALIVPWAMHNKDGELMGFEIDVAKKLARDLGVKVEFHPVPFRQLIPDLLADRYDIIISGFSIKVDRALLVNFSAPYNVTHLTLAANTTAAGGLKTLEAFNKQDITIGVVETTTAEEITARVLAQARLKTYEADSTLFEDLIEGKIHAAVTDSPRPAIVARLFPDKIATPLAQPLATFPAAFAVRRGDMDFVNFLNSWIQARTVNKWLEHRRNHWFNSTDWFSDL